MNKKITRLVVAGVMSLISAITGSVFADPIKLSPTEDSWVYQWLPNVNMPSFGYSNELPAGTTSAPGHDLISLLKFDVESTGLTEVSSATLRLYSVDPAPVRSDAAPADPDHPVTINVFALESSPAWMSNNLTFGNKPNTIGSVITSASLTQINDWLELDVTSLVNSWLAGDISNNGLQLMQQAVVPNVNGKESIALFYSSRFASEELRPQLVITPVPEPAGFVLGIAMLVTVAFIVRRRSAVQHASVARRIIRN